MKSKIHTSSFDLCNLKQLPVSPVARMPPQPLASAGVAAWLPAVSPDYWLRTPKTRMKALEQRRSFYPSGYCQNRSLSSAQRGSC